MPEQKPDLQEVLERLEKLERQNRTLKRLASVVMLLVAALFTMGQTRPNRTLEAEEFVLRDEAGKKWAALELNDVEPTNIGNARLPGGKAPTLIFFGDKGETRALLGATPSSSRLLLFDYAGNPRVALGNLGQNLPSLELNSDGTSAQLLVSMDGPYLKLEDQEGFASMLGTSSSVDARSGVSHRRPAASLVLVGKNQKVLWSAP